MISVFIVFTVVGLLGLYDNNHNGEISIRQESRIIHCESDISCRRYSKHDVFIAADIDKDFIVTSQEAEKLLNSFDQDKDGQLNNQKEISSFNRQYPESISNIFRKR